jgi:hypothetical protein
MTGFDPYHKWLGISPAEQPPHYYRLLGITLFEQDDDVISAAADRQMSFIRQHANGPHARDSQRILNELATARLCLLSDARRAKYDIELRAKLEPPQAPPSFPTVSKFAATDAAAAAPSIRVRERPSRPAAVDFTRLPVPIIAGVAAGLVVVMALGIWLAARPAKPVAQSDHSATPQSSAAPPTVIASNPSIETSSKPAPAPAPTKPKPENPAAPAPGQIDLLSKINPQRDAVRGRWKLAGGVLSVQSANSGDLLQIPVDLPDQYVLEFDVKPSQQPAGIMVGLKVGIALPNIVIDGGTGQLAGLSQIESAGAESNEATRFDGPLLTPGSWSHICCQVQEGGIIVACNGKPAIVWRGDRSRLFSSGELAPRDQHHAFVATLGKPAQFRAMVLRPLSEAERMAPFPNLPPSRPRPAPSPAPSPAPKSPANSTIDYEFERQFAQRMLDHGARSVQLRGDNQFAGGTLQKLPDWPFYVEAVEIQSPRSSITDEDLADSQRLHGLWSLSLDSDRITQKGLGPLARTGRLKSIKIGPQCRLPLTALRDCQELSSLELKGSIEMPAVMELAKQLPRLDWLSLKPSERKSLDLTELPKLPALQRVTLTDVIFDDSMLDAIAQCPKLHRLDLWRPQYALHDAATTPGNLVPMILELHGATPSEVEFKRLTRAFPRTQLLFLSNARLDHGAWSQLRNLSRLEILHAAGASITDDDLQYLPDSLIELNLSGTRITGTGFQKHASEFRNLVGLAVNDTALTDEGLKAALRVTPALQKLFVGNTKIHSEVFADVARLTFIKLVSMGGVADSDACLDRLGQSRSLQNVNGRFSTEAISRFRQACPNAHVSN